MCVFDKVLVLSEILHTVACGVAHQALNAIDIAGEDLLIMGNKARASVYLVYSSAEFIVTRYVNDALLIIAVLWLLCMLVERDLPS